MTRLEMLLEISGVVTTAFVDTLRAHGLPDDEIDQLTEDFGQRFAGKMNRLRESKRAAAR